MISMEYENVSVLINGGIVMGTEFISLYLPANSKKDDVLKELQNEVSQIENMVDWRLRGKVKKSLFFIRNKVMDSYWSNGMVFFSSGKECVVYPYFGKTKLYWCDNEFYIEPLIKDIEDLEENQK